MSVSVIFKLRFLKFLVLITAFVDFYYLVIVLVKVN